MLGNSTAGPELKGFCGSASEFLESEFDYVIVGGGTAGLVIAARLSENPNITVGVLEAGKNRIDDPIIDIPAMFPSAIHNPEYDWMFSSTPQKSNNDKVHGLTRGKMLGGSAGLNYMQYVRGSDSDYDDWASILNDPSWSSSAIKPYMQMHQTLQLDEHRSENYTSPMCNLVADNHGTSGPIHTSFNTDFFPIESDLIRACAEVTGLIDRPLDPWSGDHLGFYNNLSTISRIGANKGRRSYSARNYLEPNLDRPNLKVLCEAMAYGLEMHDDVVTGVNFSHAGNKFRVPATREVILSAGSYGSPKLLELSGIGDVEVLRQANIDCKVELPAVGNNLNEHCMVVATYELAPENVSLDVIHTPGFLELAKKQYDESHDGPLTQGATTCGYFSWTSLASNEEIRKTTELVDQTPCTTMFYKRQLDTIARHLEDPKAATLGVLLVPASCDQELAYGDPSQIVSPAKRTSDKDMGISVFIPLQYPCSRGSVHVASNDATTQPVIDPGFLSHPADATVLAVGMRLIDRCIRSSHMSSKIARRMFPDNSIDLEDIVQAERAVHDCVLTVHHPTGTCAMGQVVDSRCRVKGVSSLRIADASVFPTQVSGNILGTVYAVAEKVADMIKGDWSQ